MKFTTEMELRERYKARPFTAYEIETGTRLTPEARQFLIDRNIAVANPGESGKPPFKEQISNPISEKEKPDLQEQILYAKLRSVSALFLLTGQEFLGRDVLLAQKVFELAKQLRNGYEKTVLRPVEEFPWKACTGIGGHNLDSDIGDCFELTEFHVQLEKGYEIALLHRLRCALREILPLPLEQEQIRCTTNRLCNQLSQLICLATGGKTCQRQDPSPTATS